MKKFLATLVMVALVVSATSAVAGVTGQVETAMKAEVWAQYEITHFHFEGYVDFQRMLEDGTTEWVSMEFIRNGNGMFPYIEVGGDILWDDAENPKRSLPGNVVGEVHNFHLYLRAMDGNTRVAYGNFHDPYLDEDDRITVELRLANQSQFILFEVPEGSEARDLLLQLEGGSSYSTFYDEFDGGFWVWFDPNWGQIGYRVIDVVTGETVDTGVISPLGDHESDEGYSVNVVYDDGLEILNLGLNSRKFLRGLGFPGNALDEEAGVMKDAKVFLINRPEERYTTISLQGFEGPVMVYKVGADGREPYPFDYWVYNYSGGPSAEELQVQIAELQALIEALEESDDDSSGPSVEEFQAQIAAILEQIEELESGEKAAIGSYSEIRIPAGPSQVIVEFYGHGDFNQQFSATVCHGGCGLG